MHLLGKNVRNIQHHLKPSVNMLIGAFCWQWACGRCKGSPGPASWWKPALDCLCCSQGECWATILPSTLLEGRSNPG